MTLTSQAEVLFASILQPSIKVTRSEVDAAISHSLRTNGGVSGCAAVMATAYGEDPYSATHRMHWALEAAATISHDDQ